MKKGIDPNNLKNVSGGSSSDNPAFCGPFTCPHCHEETIWTYIPSEASGKEGDVTATCTKCLGKISIKLGAGL